MFDQYNIIRVEKKMMYILSWNKTKEYENCNIMYDNIIITSIQREKQPTHHHTRTHIVPFTIYDWAGRIFHAVHETALIDDRAHCEYPLTFPSN